ncbi:hypothetical protein, partial [Paenibacillus sp. FSL R7-0273]|uniref:hypothetical protein n=1 Tax=Paenibacillus sp. FSL R7-0273 TaxID=1536772 RepID=UPI00097A6AC1
LERAIAHFETSDENLHSLLLDLTEVISDTHSLFSFQRSSSLLPSMFSSAATLILYHIQPIVASSFLISFFELSFDAFQRFAARYRIYHVEKRNASIILKK